LSVQGRGIDAILVEVCALKIIVLWNDAERSGDLRLYCNALNEYVNTTLSMTSGRPHELMFNKTCTILVVLHLLQSLSGSITKLERQGTMRQMKHENSILSIKIPSNLDDSDTQSLEKVLLLAGMRDVINEELIRILWADCNPQLSVFTLVSLSLLCKVKVDMKYGVTNQGSLKMTEGSIGSGVVLPTLNMNREVPYQLHQLMLNGSCAKKIKVLEQNRLLGLTSAVGKEW